MRKKELNKKRKKQKTTKQADQKIQNESSNDEALISYLGSLYGLLEGGTASREEIKDFIKTVRQQGMDRQCCEGYIATDKNQNPSGAP